MLSVLRSKILTQESAEVENLCAKLHLALCNPTDYSPPGFSVHGISRQEYWSGLPFPSPEDLPDSGTEPVSLASLALAGGFFTHWTTWEPKEKLEGQLIQQLSNVIKKPRFLLSFCLAISERFSLSLAKTPYIWLQGIWHSLSLYIKMGQCLSPLWVIYFFF